MTLIVDVHSHIYPDWYLDFFRKRDNPPCLRYEEQGIRLLLNQTHEGVLTGPIMTPQFMDLGAKLEFMNAHGIDCSIVSLGNPWLDAFGPDESVELAREANAQLSTYRSTYAGRIVGMGILPSAEPPIIAHVIAEVANDSGLRGVISGPRIGGLLLDDVRLEPVWEALARRRVPIMIHPFLPTVPEELAGYELAVVTAVGFPFVTTAALARLILGKVLVRHPELRVVAAHAGGALPFLLGRLEAAHSDSEGLIRRSAGQLLMDAVVYDPLAIQNAFDLVGPGRLMFGTDHPFPNEDCVRTMKAIELGLGSEAQADVMGMTAANWYELGSTH